MTTAPPDADLAAYVAAARRLMDRGGYERTGSAADARRWDVAHIRAWLDARGAPDDRPTVHVAGSKGKGSTAAMAEAILRAHLARAGGGSTLLLTSPDLHQKRERIAIDGAAVSHAEFARLADDVLDDPTTAGWSLFEVVTAMGWLAGAAHRCAWQVLEVGLGGRLDTTNAVRPAAKAVAVITPIDLEHTAILGRTIPEVAAEKAGIVTPGCDVVVSPMRASALDVIRERAREAGAALHEVAVDCALRVESQGLDGQRFVLRTPLQTYPALRLPLLGAHQVENAAAAVRAVEIALARGGAGLEVEAVRDGLAGVRWPGRLEVLRERPTVIVDGLHTPLAARRVRQSLDALGVRRRVIVLGLLDGKDADAIAAALVAEQDEVIVAPPDSARAADPATVARAVAETGAMVQRAPSVAEAIERACALAGERGAVLVAGSLYTAAEAREALLPIVGDRALGLR